MTVSLLAMCGDILGIRDCKEKLGCISEEYRFGQKVCPMLRDSACWRSGEITQPRTNFLANSVQWCSISVVTWLKGRACMQCDGEKVNTPLFVPTCSNGNANDYREQNVLHMSFVDLGL